MPDCALHGFVLERAGRVPPAQQEDQQSAPPTVVDDVTREPVEAADKGRGYEYAKNSYLLIEDEELEAIEVESNHIIEIDLFVPRSQIDERFLVHRF